MMALLDRGTPERIQRICEAGWVLGEVPANILVAGIREMFHCRCLPLAIERPGVHMAHSDDRVDTLVTAQLVGDPKLHPAVIGRSLAQVMG